MKKSNLRTWQLKCDRLMQEKGRELYPNSLLSGLPTEVMHHFFPKSVSARLRYDFDNLIPLTNGEHMRLHQSGDPSYEMRIIYAKGEVWYDKLAEKKKEFVRVNVGYYQDIYEKLKNL